MRRLTRLLLIGVLGLAALAVAPVPAANASLLQRFAVEGTITTLHPSLINAAINIPRTGFTVGSVTANSAHLDQRVANFGRVAVRVTPDTTFRVFDNGRYRNTTYDRAVRLGTPVWAFGYMVPLPTGVSVDEAVATQVVIGSAPTSVQLRFGLDGLMDYDRELAYSLPGGGCDICRDRASSGPDLTGQAFRYQFDSQSGFGGSEDYVPYFILDDGAGSTLYGDGFEENANSNIRANDLVIRGGTGRWAGATGAGLFNVGSTEVTLNVSLPT